MTATHNRSGHGPCRRGALRKTLLLGAGLVALLPVQAVAQAISPQEAAELRAQIAALKAQLGALEARLDRAGPQGTETQAADRQAADGQAAGGQGEGCAQAVAPIVSPPPARIAAAGSDETTVSWKGAPEFKGPNGWSFKPRGRMQLDAAYVAAPAAIDNPGLGFSNEIRRGYLGAQGTIPGGFGYRFEVDLAQAPVEITDAFITYDKGGFNLTVGQQKNFNSIEDMESDTDATFMERAAFIQAFGFERRLGVSAGYQKGDFLANAGVFTDNLLDLGSDSDNAVGADGRIVWMPKTGGTQFHFATSLHWRNLNALSATAVRYRTRPFTHTTDVRFISTPGLHVEREMGAGFEGAMISGPLHVTGEAYVFHPRLVSGPSPTFFGGYAEVGYFLTRGDTRPYRNGMFGAIRPVRGLDRGGPGAIQLNLRYDYLDLNDAGIVGGMQNGYYSSLSWTPVEHVRLLIDYGHIDYRDAAILAGTRNDYGVDVVGTRAQVDF